MGWYRLKYFRYPPWTCHVFKKGGKLLSGFILK